MVTFVQGLQAGEALMIPSTTFEWLSWKLQKNLRSRGFAGTGRVCLLKIADLFNSFRSGERRMLREAKAYDRQFNITTSYHVPVTEFDASDRPPQGYDYQPTTPVALRRILNRLNIPLSDFVFVDLGCGMGRAVFVATEFPFSKVIGVEYSAKLYEIAAENVRTFRSPARKCRDIEMVWTDAAKYALPEQDTVFYLYNPFGKDVLQGVMENIEQSLADRPRRIFVVYHHPLHAAVLENTLQWEKIASGEPQPGSHGFAIYQNRRTYRETQS
jgi:SAM-dependent methyltransferase